MHYIVESTEESALEIERVGGKGASLGRLKRLGVPVPDYFVIDAQAFRAMDGADFEADFLAELASAYERLGSAPVAVRSSAISEDSASASHAGLYETVLDVRGFEAVLDAVRRCWASHHVSYASEYRTAHHVDGEDAMALVVQRFVPAEWAGVSFTADPVRPALTRMVINAVPGIGEALVSGATTPEQYLLDRASGAVLSHAAGDSSSSLPAEILQQVWRLSKQVADAWSFPQDLEWAVTEGAVQLLQSRPITTLSALYYNRHLEPWRDTPRDAEDQDKLWSRVYADEIWSSPISPLFYNVQNLSPSFTAWRRWHHDTRPISPVIFKYYKAAAYLDVEILQEKYEYHPAMARLAGVLGFFPSDMRQQVRTAPFRWWGRLRRHFDMEFRDRKVRSLKHNHRHLAHVWPPLIERSDAWYEIDLDELTLDELLQHQEDVRQEQIRVSQPCQYAVAYHAHDLTFFLTGLLDRWFGDGANLYARVSSGLVGSEAVQEADHVWQLAELARDCGPEAVAHLQKTDWKTLTNDVHPALAAFVDRILPFWRSHRHRGASYKDLVYPRWGDDPDLLLNLIKGYLGSDALRPIEQNAKQADARRSLQEDLLSQICGPTAAIRRRLLSTLFRYNEIYMGLRDNHRFYFDRIWYALRRIYASQGQRLARRGILAAADDVFFLGVEEIRSAMDGTLDAAEAGARVTWRRQEWNETLSVQPPKFLRGYTPAAEDAHGADPSALTGIGASPGIAVGRARVVRSLSELSVLEDHDILITRQTDPGWTAVFPRIAGLVLETGGALAHGASLCREYGLPCVTAVDRAMQRIPDGAEVSIDGGQGTVSIKKP
ncbi:MAG: PEP/pyruvate-binding domain-containing protein [Pseudomonadales bacterium]